MSTTPYRTLLTDQLTDERAKKNTLEQRGIAVISTSGTLVTITLGFVALATRAQTYVPVVDAGELAAASGDGDLETTTQAEHQVLAQLLTNLRRVNGRRARILFAALLAEVVALAVMAVAVVVALAPLMS